jgi:hypothetical protein
MQIKTYENDNLENQELLTLDSISPVWAKRLEESKLLPILSLERVKFISYTKFVTPSLQSCNESRT